MVVRLNWLRVHWEAVLLGGLNLHVLLSRIGYLTVTENKFKKYVTGFVLKVLKYHVRGRICLQNLLKMMQQFCLLPSSNNGEMKWMRIV